MREVDGHPVITNAKITELLVTEGVERTSTDEAIAGDIVAVAGHSGDHDRRHAGRHRARPRAAAHHRRRAGHLGDHRHQHLPAGRQGVRAQADRAHGEEPTGLRTCRQRVHQGRRHRPAGRVGGAGPRRAGPGGPGRADAPGRLRAHRRQAAGGHQDRRRQAARAVRGDDHRLPRRVRRRDHSADGRPQGPHGRDGQPRRGLGPDGLHRAEPRADRLPHRLPHPHPRHRHRQRRVRRLPAVGRRDPGPPHRVAGLRPDRLDHAVRDDPTVRSWAVLRRAGR